MIIKKQLPYLIIAGITAILLIPITISLNSLNSISEQINLRAQAAPGNKVTTKIKEFTWTPNEETGLGSQTLTITATDEEGNTTTKDIIITVVEENIIISDVVITPAEQEATIVWQTIDKDTTPHVDYDVSSTFRKSTDGDKAAKTKKHSITLANLLECTIYDVRIKATGIKAEKQDSIRTFSTRGCVGNASVEGLAREDIASAQGGTITLADKIAIAVPADFTAADANFQIKQLTRSAVLDITGTPEDLSPITGLYNLSAYSNAETRLSEFDQPISVTVKYTPSDNTDLETFALYRHDGTDWSVMEDCNIDQDNQNITCTTTSFSQVAGFAVSDETGEPEPEPSPNPSPSPVESSAESLDSEPDTVTSDEEEPQPTPAKKTVKSKGKPSPVALYTLNSVIRRILGKQFVTPDIHSYYMNRLKLRSNERGYVKSTTHLENIMKYWKTVNPKRPIGKKATSTTVNQPALSESILNSVIRRILGDRFIIPDIHSYYLKRLNAPKNSREYISSLQKLENVMQYWKFVRPARPRGD